MTIRIANNFYIKGLSAKKVGAGPKERERLQHDVERYKAILAFHEEVLEFFDREKSDELAKALYNYRHQDLDWEELESEHKHRWRALADTAREFIENEKLEDDE